MATISAIIISLGFFVECTLCAMPTWDYSCPVSPDICPNPNITFNFFTREMQFTPMIINPSYPWNVKNLLFDPRLPIKVIIHGVGSSGQSTPCLELRPAYLDGPEPVNVVCVDFTPLALPQCIMQGLENMDLIARCIAYFIESLINVRGIRREQVHFIGHSTGAHIAAQTRVHLRGPIHRITALDPANLGAPEMRIKKGSAQFIDVIHTNSGDKSVLYPVSGDVEFYVNGGVDQPTCGSNELCDHTISAEYFAESVGSPVGFHGRRCPFFDYYNGFCQVTNTSKYVCNVLGEHTNLLSSGVYFVETKLSRPFALGRPPSCI